MDQVELLRRVVDMLEEHGVTYMLVGSFASTIYGEARLTHDIDIVVQLPPSAVGRLCQAFPAPDFYVSEVAAREAVTRGGQFNVIHPTSGNKIDFMIARNDAWGRSQISRRVKRTILPDRTAFIAAPEDVILGKLWYYEEGGSEKHLRDIAAMLQISGPEIDQSYIERWAELLGFTETWHAILDRLKIWKI